jgi:hypothetical protein
MTTEQKKLYETIDEILWKDWDPIGVNDIEDVRDEYQSYTPQIFSLVIHGADEIQIAEHLLKIATIDMGLTENKKYCGEIAKKILEAKN